MAAPREGSALSADTSERANEVKLDNYLKKYGVPIQQRATLIQKYRSNKIWDSLSGKKKPSSVEVKKANGQKIVIDRYPDGSVVVTTTDLVDPSSLDLS